MGFEGYDTSNGRLGILGYIYIYILCIYISYIDPFCHYFKCFLSLHYYFSTEAKLFSFLFSWSLDTYISLKKINESPRSFDVPFSK